MYYVDFLIIYQCAWSFWSKIDVLLNIRLNGFSNFSFLFFFNLPTATTTRFSLMVLFPVRRGWPHRHHHRNGGSCWRYKRRPQDFIRILHVLNVKMLGLYFTLHARMIYIRPVLNFERGWTKAILNCWKKKKKRLCWICAQQVG